MKSKKQLDLEKNLKNENKLTPTQEQMLMSKNKYDIKLKLAEKTYEIHEKAIELEKLKHKNILAEIILMSGKIKNFVR